MAESERAMLGLTVLLLAPLLAEPIINGVWTNPGDMRSVASLFLHFPHHRDENRTFCGGVLVASNVVLTAAHCVYSDSYFTSLGQVTVNDYNVYATDKLQDTQFSRAIDVLPAYHEKKQFTGEDLALMYLPHPVTVCKDVDGPQIARLPPTNDSMPEKPNLLYHYYNQPLTDAEISSSLCLAHGWGVTESGLYSHIPKTAAMRISVKQFSQGRVLVGQTFDPNTKVCHGDSGGPVFCLVRGQRYLVGIMTEIGSWVPGKFNETLKDDEFTRCKKLDFVTIVDLRDKMSEIARILASRGLVGQLAAGQQACAYA